MGHKNTLLTVSEQTGYSVSTVSRVLSGKARKYRISREAEEKITAEAERLNYQPNLIAQTLRTQQSKTIGLLIPSVDNPFFASLAGIIIGILNSKGYHTLLADSRESGKDEIQELRMFMSRSVDGIICIPASSTPDFHEQVSSQIPMVLVDRHFKSTSLSYVCTDNYAGARMATDYLLSKGYKSILAIQGVPDSMPNRERVRGFMKAMGEEGLTEYARLAGDEFSVQNGYLSAKLLLFGKEPPTAIFALSNNIMLGALKAIRESDLSVPEDISLISFDDNLYMDYLTPSITRVGQPVENMAKLAVKILLEHLDHNGTVSASSQIRLLPSIIPGNSVANA